MRKARQNVPKRSKLYVYASLFILFIAITVIIVIPSGRETDFALTADESTARPATVVACVPTARSATISGFAEAMPRWNTTLRAQVDGLITNVSDSFQSGARIRKNQVIVQIDSTAWYSNLAEAENRLALARLSLLREENEAKEALRSWTESGFPEVEATSLVRRTPQIDAARAELEAALSNRDYAFKQLEWTRVRAPFDCVVRHRLVSRGQSITAGEPVAELLGTEVFELTLNITEADWRILPEGVIGLPAKIRNPNGPETWQGKIVRSSQFIDFETRMRAIHIVVESPLDAEPSLFPGTFVEIRVIGRKIDSILELPESALTRSGTIWFVDENRRLQSFAANPLFTANGYVYVKPESKREKWHIIRYPLESYMPGMLVDPVLEKHPVSKES